MNSRPLHAFRLKNSPAFAGSFSQAEAVKPQPTFSLPGSSDIERLSPSKFLAPSAQSFEPRLRCKPAGFRNPAVIRRPIPCTRLATLNCCRLLAHLHLRSQQPVTFRLSSFATGPCSIGTLGPISRPNQPCDWLFSDKTAGSNRRFRHPPPFEDFRFETQARAIWTSHARVGETLLLSPTGARGIRANFVGFLFKTRPFCGVGWKRCWDGPELHISLCCRDGAKGSG